MTDKTTVLPTPDGFETFADAKERRARKIRILSQGEKDQQRLAAQLKRCRKGSRCESGAATSACVCTGYASYDEPARYYLRNCIGHERQSFPPAFYFFWAN
jgi:hypothetical protein